MKWIRVVIVIIVIGIAFSAGRYTAPEDITEYTEIQNEKEITKLANQYLIAAPYSEKGLVETLVKYEHCDEDTAIRVVKKKDVDWQEQANRELNKLLNSSGYSEKQVREYLARDLYSEQQIDTAMAQISPDWSEQAKKCMQALKNSGVQDFYMTGTLLTRGFTLEQIKD